MTAQPQIRPWVSHSVRKAVCDNIRCEVYDLQTKEVAFAGTWDECCSWMSSAALSNSERKDG